jgi:hypothetical protein
MIVAVQSSSSSSYDRHRLHTIGIVFVRSSRLCAIVIVFVRSSSSSYDRRCRRRHVAQVAVLLTRFERPLGTLFAGVGGSAGGGAVASAPDTSAATMNYVEFQTACRRVIG